MAAVALVAAALAGAVYGGQRLRLEREHASCVQGEVAFGSVWDDQARQTVRGAFDASGLPYAGSLFQSVDERMREYRDEWSSQFRDACEARHVRKIQSQEQLDLRLACLERRRFEAKAVVSALAAQDRVSRAPELFRALTPVARCADGVQLGKEDVGGPQLWELSRKVAALSVQVEAGDYENALASATELMAEAEKRQAPTLSAEASLEGARAALRLSRAEPARRLALETVHRAVALDAPHLMLRGASVLMELLSGRQRDSDEAAEWGRFASAALARVDAAELSGMIENQLGLLEGFQGKWVQAQPHFQAATAFFERVGKVRDSDLARSLNNLALAHLQQQQPAKAMPLLIRARDTLVGVYGPWHGEVAKVELNVGVLHLDEHRLDEAVAHFERALEIQTRAQLSDHPNTASMHTNLGDALFAQKKWDQALHHFRSSLEVRKKALGPTHPKLSRDWVAIGQVQLEKGQRMEAVSSATRAMSLLQSPQAQPIERGSARFFLARALGSSQRARSLAEAREAKRELLQSGPEAKPLIAEVDEFLKKAQGEFP